MYNLQERLIQQSSPMPNATLTLSLMCYELDMWADMWKLVAAIFDVFPDKDYLLVGLQHGEKVPKWLGKFGQLPPAAGTQAPQIIYVINRHAVRFDGFTVRRGRPEDMKDVRRLVGDLPNAAAIQHGFFR